MPDVSLFRISQASIILPEDLKKFTHNCPPGGIFQSGIYRAPTKCQLSIRSPALHMAVLDVLVCSFFIFQLGLSDLARHGVCLY